MKQRQDSISSTHTPIAPKLKNIAILGSSSIGKTTLLSLLINPSTFSFSSYFSEPTLISEVSNHLYKFHDCGGKSTFDKLRDTFYSNYDIEIFLFCFDVSDRESYVMMKKYLHRFNTKCKKGKVIVIVGLKSDLIVVRNCCASRSEIRGLMKKYVDVFGYIEVSAKSRQNIEVLNEMLEKVGESNQLDLFSKEKIGFYSYKYAKKKKKKKKSKAKGDESLGLVGRSFDIKSNSLKYRKERRAKGKSLTLTKKEIFDFFKKVSGKQTVIKGNYENEYEMEKKRQRDIKIARPMHLACIQGDVETLKKMIESGNNVNVINSKCNTPLHYAVFYNNTECVRELLKTVLIDAEVCSDDGETPLTLACKRGHSTIAKVLLESVDRNRKNRNGESPMDCASKKKIKNVLNEQIRRENAFLNYVTEKKFIDVKNNVDSVYINCENEDGDNALDIAIQSPENGRMVEFLISKGIDIKKNESTEYTKLLRKRYREMKSEIVVRELYLTELIFNEDLKVLIDLFVKPGKQMLNQLIPNDEYRKKSVIDLFKGVLMLDQISDKLLETFKSTVKKEGFSDIQRIATLYKELNFDGFINYIHNQISFLDDYRKNRESYGKLVHFISVQQEKIPQPRSRRFTRLIEKPRLRIIKYQDFLERLKKLVNTKNLKNGFADAKERIRTEICKLEKGMMNMRLQSELIKISELFKRNYNFDVLLLKKDRKFIWKNENQDIIWSFDKKDNEVVKAGIYVFSDSVFITQNNTLEYFLFFDSKIVLTVYVDNIRVRIYKNGGKSIDMIVKCDSGDDLISLMGKGVFESKTSENENDQSLYISSKILIIDHIQDEKKINSFLDLNIIDLNIIERKEKQLSIAKDSFKEYKTKYELLKKQISELESDIKIAKDHLESEKEDQSLALNWEKQFKEYEEQESKKKASPQKNFELGNEDVENNDENQDDDSFHFEKM